MKSKEYYRLARLTLKNNAKASRATIRGLAFGFVLIIPIILALIGINSSINGYLNEKPYYNYFELQMADYRVVARDNISENNMNLAGSKQLDELMKAPNVLTQIVYEKYVLSEKTYSFVKDGKEVSSGKIESDINKRFNIIDMDKSSSAFPSSLGGYPNGIFARGDDFVGNGKGEVIISQKFAEALNVSIDDAYNSYLTIQSSIFPKLVETQVPEKGEEYYLCNSYKVVGVVKSEVADEFDRYDYMQSSIFFTSSNVYDESGEGALKGRANSDRYITYDNWENRKVLNQEYMMITTSTFDVNDGNNSTTWATTTLYTECSGFAELNDALNFTKAYLNKNFTTVKDTMIQESFTYTMYEKIYDLSSLVIFAILTVGIVLLLCAIINLGCTIAHSVKERSGYLAMLRAIGANSDIIPKLYLSEALIIIGKASMFVLTFGIALAIGVKILLNAVIKNAGIAIPISIPWWGIAVSVFLSIGLLVTIGIAFAYVLTSKLSKASITEQLKDGV